MNLYDSDPIKHIDAQLRVAVAQRDNALNSLMLAQADLAVMAERLKQLEAKLAALTAPEAQGA